MGVIKAVRNSLNNSEDVTALWVTHRLEELEYADGAIYMEDGKVVMHGDVASVQSFIKSKQSDYIKRIYYEWLAFLFQLMFSLLHYNNIAVYNFVSSCYIIKSFCYIICPSSCYIMKKAHTQPTTNQSYLLIFFYIIFYDSAICFHLINLNEYINPYRLVVTSYVSVLWWLASNIQCDFLCQISFHMKNY